MYCTSRQSIIEYDANWFLLNSIVFQYFKPMDISDKTGRHVKFSAVSSKVTYSDYFFPRYRTDGVRLVQSKPKI